jgi:hypothetical protein
MKEIGTKPQKFTWKFRIIFCVISGLLFSLLMWCINWVFGEAESLNYYIFNAVFFGLFWGLGYLYFMEYFAKRWNKKVAVNPKLLEKEEIQVYGPANYANIWVAVGGKLFITDHRLIFKSHKYNFNRPQINIELDQIENITLKSPLNLFDSMMVIKVSDGKICKFNVNEREVWLEYLQAKRSDLSIA